MEDWQKYLESIYLDPSHPGSFTGPETYYKVVLAEGIFKICRHRDPRNKVQIYPVTLIINRINSQVDMDLMDMVDLAKRNDGYQYLLVCNNIFSR